MQFVYCILHCVYEQKKKKLFIFYSFFIFLQTANSHIKQQAIKNYHKEEDEQELRDIREEQANNIGKINEILEELRYIAYPEEQAA